MLICVNVWLVLAPLLAVQYILATAALIVLSRRDCSAKAYAVWNVCILLVFFAGSIAFFVYNACRPRPRSRK